jgi:hypothetical protein
MLIPPKQILAIQILYPPHGFHIANLTQVPLGSGEVGVSQDNLTDNFHRDARAGCIRGRMASEVMGPEMDPHQSASFLDQTLLLPLSWCKLYRSLGFIRFSSFPSLLKIYSGIARCVLLGKDEEP